MYMFYVLIFGVKGLANYVLFEGEKKSIHYFIYSTTINWMLLMCQAGTVLDSGVAKTLLHQI